MKRRPESGVRSAVRRKVRCGASPPSSWSLSITAALKPGAFLVFAVCSLEPEEGEDQIAAFLGRTPAARPVAIEAAAFGLPPEAQRPAGLRILPSMLGELGGLDGFFVAALTRAG